MNKRNVLITIVTPSFNSEKTISRTIESVLNQSYQNFEYIIIDGGSTDKTLEIIESYSKKFKGKLSYISERDNGIYDAMNKGIEKAKGDFIGIINSDDYYERDALETIVENLGEEKYQILYGAERILNEGKEESLVFYNHHFLWKQMIAHPTCFVSKCLYNDFGTFDLQYKSAADYDFMIKMSLNEKVSFKPIYKLISNFEIGGMSSKSIGNKENAIIRLKYNLISKKMYRLLMIKYRIKRYFLRK